ncbi:hypothetical protein AN643_01940 [Candidatus Epulonipiscioides saccharophilum]|nr:hypothetical protein AN643_01940 [Epulopiscium sp. SCG-B10WGA-EpuloB]
MKILLMSIGTRGDCEPFLALANMLREKGHDIICAFPEQYCHLAQEENLEYRSLGPEFLELIDSDTGRYIMGGKSALKKLKLTIDLYKQSKDIQKKILNIQELIVKETDPDYIIFHPKIMYAIPWHMATGKNIRLLCPVPCMLHPVKGFASIGINKNLGPFFNDLSYKLVNQAMGLAIKVSAKDSFPDKKYKTKEFVQELKSVKLIYSISPSILKYQENWPNNINISGFLERDKVHAWTPPAGFDTFLNSHKKIMLISFGSMINSDPKKTTEILLTALKNCDIPAILNISGGGLIEPENYDKQQFFFTQSIPYDYILPKVYATVHHGGAGTTHSSLKAGCATMAIPHTVDQPLWNQWIYNLGAGPKGIPISKINPSNLSKKLSDLYTNPRYKSTAQNLQKEMLSDNNFEELYNFIIDPNVN